MNKRQGLAIALAWVLVFGAVSLPALADGSPGTPSLTLVGSALWTKAHDIAFQGTFGYCAFGNGLIILDLADPKKPVRISDLYLGGGFALSVHDDWAYLAAGRRGLAVIDISNPKAPALRGSLELGGEARDVIVDGSRAFVACGAAGLRLVDIKDPSSPRTVGTWTASGEVNHLALRGDRLYVAAGSAGFCLLNVADAAAPVLLSSLALDGTAEGIALSGNWVYLADGDSGLRVVNVSNSAEPRLAVSLTSSGYCHSVSCEGQTLCTGSLYDGGYQLYDLSNPAAPALLSTNKYTMYNEGWNVVLRAGRLAVIDYFSGIFFMDISNRAAPALSGLYFTPSSIVAAAVHDRFALAVGELSGLEVLDIGFPARPLPVGTTDIFRGVQGLAVAGDWAYVTDRWSVRVFDLKSIKRPVQVQALSLPGGVPRTIVARGRQAFLTADLAGLYVLDTADPANPKVLGEYRFPGFAYGLAVDRDFAYLAHSDMGLLILDVRNPRLPIKVGRLKIDGEPSGVAVLGHWAYVAAGPAGLKVIDISRPETPKLAATVPVEDFASSVVVTGDVAFVADGKAGVKKYSIADPAAPKLEAAFDTPGEAVALAFCASLLMVADSDSLLILK
jgi:hypothetical protein